MPSHSELCQIVTPIGMLGYGFDESLQRSALKELASKNSPTAIILDSGSTDSGPTKLALGQMTLSLASYRRDLEKLLSLGHEFRVPVIISSAGGDGANDHVDAIYEIVKDICAVTNNKAYRFKVIRIHSNITKHTALERFKAGKITSCGPSVPGITSAAIQDAVTIASQMGPEPFLDAMHAEPEFDIIIGGRAYDPSPYIAWCLYTAGITSPNIKAMDRDLLGSFAHMGKIMECGAVCATPKSASALATVYRNASFDICPLSPEARCTPTSVAAHTLYEKTRPDFLAGPGGVLDLTASTYEQLDDSRSVRSRGARFLHHSDKQLPYTVKLEGAKVAGYRSLVMGGIRDPILNSQIDAFIVRIKEYVASQIETTGWKLEFHIFGRDGVMSSLEPGSKDFLPREIFLVGETLAETQELAKSIASVAKVAVTHGPYPGQKATAGNFAWGIGGRPTIEMGLTAEFCLYHLMELEDGEERGAAEGTASNAKYRWKTSIVGDGLGVLVRTEALPTKQTQRPRHIPNINLTDPITLGDLASVVRSKNAGPFEITLDVMFDHDWVYRLVKDSRLLGPATIAKLYHLEEKEIIWIGYFDPALAFKATIPRKRHGMATSCGGFMESDMHGSQQHVGILELVLPDSLREDIKRRIEVDE